MIMGLLRRLVALMVFIACGYVLYHYGIGDVNSQAVVKGFRSPFLGYLPERLSSNALVAQAQPLAVAFPEQSEASAVLALRQNPSNGGAATHLMSLYEAQGRAAEADQVAELASKLWPAHTYTRSNLADYWLRRDRPDKQVQEWNVLLTRDRSFRKTLFPLLKKVVERDDLSPIILPFVQAPPVWWDSFFAYLSRDLEFSRLADLYRLRVAAPDGLSLSEQNNYVKRLIKERRWEEAHDTWFLALTPRQMRYGSGLLYDGGFESDVFNQAFGWRLSRSKNPRIKPDITYGIKGRKALQVILRKQDPINFRHISQRLMLSKGTYQLGLRYRTDTLKTTKGLSWRIRCVEGGKEVLGESTPLLGSNPWSSLSVNFTVPESCSVRMLRLVSTSRFRHDQFYQGSAWFDDIQINSVDFQEAVK